MIMKELELLAYLLLSERNGSSLENVIPLSKNLHHKSMCTKISSECFKILCREFAREGMQCQPAPAALQERHHIFEAVAPVTHISSHSIVKVLLSQHVPLNLSDFCLLQSRGTLDA